MKRCMQSEFIDSFVDFYNTLHFIWLQTSQYWLIRLLIFISPCISSDHKRVSILTCRWNRQHHCCQLSICMHFQCVTLTGSFNTPTVLVKDFLLAQPPNPHPLPTDTHGVQAWFGSIAGRAEYVWDRGCVIKGTSSPLSGYASESSVVVLKYCYFSQDCSLAFLSLLLKCTCIQFAETEWAVIVAFSDEERVCRPWMCVLWKLFLIINVFAL